jgi:hypothetical protein
MEYADYAERDSTMAHIEHHGDHKESVAIVLTYGPDSSAKMLEDFLKVLERTGADIHERIAKKLSDEASRHRAEAHKLQEGKQ